MNIPEVLVVHHTGGTNANPLFDTSNQTMEIVDAYHKSLGWDGIGYNWFIEKSGLTKKGRDETKTGAHTIGWNNKSIGVCLAGNFDATYPTPEQIKSFQILYKEIVARYPVLTPDKVFPHRKFANKTCYGRKLTDNWASDLARQALNTISPPTSKEEIKKQIVSLLGQL